MEIEDLITPESVIARLRASSKKQVLQELAKRAAETTGLPERAIFDVLLERERLGTTGVGDGIAIPHGKLDSVGRLVGALGRAVDGIEFESIDGKPTNLVFMLVAPASSTGVHLKALARLSRLFRDGEFRKRLLDAPSAEAMYQVIVEEDAKY